MKPADRIICALKKGIPDMVPYMYNCIDKDLQERIIQREISEETVTPLDSWGYLARPGGETQVVPALTAVPGVAARLGLDAIGIQVLPPLFVNSDVRDGRAQVKEGLLDSYEALRKVRMPDPDDERLYRRVETMLDRYKGDYAIYARVRLGASPTLLSMGMEGFAYSLCDEPELAADILDMYCTWSSRVSRNLSELDFDFFWCFDDIAFKTAPMFSKDTLRELFLPRLKKAAEGIKKPWVYHSDGNLVPILDDLLSLGMDGIHPLEPGAMDLDWLKANYGSKVCLIGNINIDSTLSRGTVEDVFREVEERIRQLGPGGGYIISDSNSVPSYCKPENIIAMSEAVHKFRHIYQTHI